MSFSRRDLLRLGGVSTVIGMAGCIDLGGCTHTADFILVPASPAELTERLTIPVTRLGPPDQRLVRSAIESEVTYRDCNQRIRDRIHVVDGTYYQLSSSVTTRESATLYRIDLEGQSPDTSTAAPTNQIISFEELPRIDQQALAGVLAGLIDGDDLSDLNGSGPMCYPINNTKDSVLVPSSQYRYLRYKGTLIEFSLKKPVDVSATLQTFQMQADEVASSPEAFAQYAYQQILSDVVDLDEMSLTQQQETFLNRAIREENRDGMSTCVDDPSTAFEDLIRMIFDVGEDFTHFVPEEPKPVIWTEERYLATYRLSAP